MTAMNLKPALQYRFRDSIKSAGVFFGIIALVTLGISLTIINLWVHMGEYQSGSVSVFTVSASIMLFVTGICAIREDLRVFIQNGIGRRTAFVANLLAAAGISAILSVAGELLLVLAQALTVGNPNFLIVDVYQQAFMGGARYSGWDLLNHLKSILFCISIFLLTYTFGSFISLVFFRLNKFWTIVVAVGGPMFFLTLLPDLIVWSGLTKTVLWQKMVAFIFGGPWSSLCFFLFCAAILAGLSWLLIRRAYIKPAAK